MGGPSAPPGVFKAPHVRPFHRYLAIGFGASMWFWIFYRVRL